MASEKIELEIIAKFDQALAELKRFSNGAEKTFEGIQKQTSTANLAFSSFVGNLSANIALKAVETLGAAFGELTAFIGDSIAASAEQEAAINSLNQSLASSGNFSVEASKAFIEYAESLEKTTKFSDDLIIKNAAMLESLAGLSEEGLEQATQAAVDLASTGLVSLEDAFLKVAKAAEGEVGSFKKIGIEIKKGNSDAETFSNTISQLNERFGGRAAAELNTYAGALAQNANKFNSLQEAVGDTITQNGFFVEIIKLSGEVLDRFTQFIKNNSDTIKVGLATAFATVIDLTRGLLAGLDPIARTIVAVFETIGKAIGGVALAIVEVAQGNFKTAGAAIKETFIGIGETIDEQFGKFGALQGFADTLGEVKNRAGDAFATFQTGAQRAGEITNATTGKTKELNEAQKELLKTAEDILKAKEKELAAGQDSSKAEQELALLEESFLLKQGLEAEHLEAVKVLRTEADIGEAERLLARNELLAQIDGVKNAAEIDANKKRVEALLADEDQSSTKVLQIKAKQVAAERKLRQQALNDTQSFFGDLLTLSQGGNRSLFEFAKNAALATAIVRGYEAVQVAYATGGPFPVNLLAAAAVAARTAVQIKGISATQFQFGSDSVPGIGNRDSVPALLTPGERVVPRRTNQDLTLALAGSGQTNELLQAIVGRLDRLENNVVVNIGAKEIIDTVNTGIREGRVVGL